MKDIRTFVKILKQIYFILSKRQRLQIVCVFIILFIGSALELLGVSSILPFVQAIMQPNQLLENRFVGAACDFFGINSPMGIITFVGIGIIVVYLFKNSYLAFSSYIQALYSGHTRKELSMLMLNSYMGRSYSFFVDNGTDVILYGVHSDIAAVLDVIQNGFKLLSEVLVIILVTVFLMSTDLWLTLGVSMVGAMSMLIIVFILKKRISQASSRMRLAGIRQFKILTQITGGIKDIFVYNRQKHFVEDYRRVSDDVCKSSVFYTAIGNLPERVIESFCISGIIGAVLIRLYMGVDASVFVPKLAVFAVGAFRLLPSMSRTTGYINAFIYNRGWVESVYNNVTEARALNSVSNENYDSKSSMLHERKIEFTSRIRVDNIMWKYPESQKNVLDMFSLDIIKGETVGIIGESGSGKSTFSDLLLRLYRPQDGVILMDNTNIDNIPVLWSHLIGYVPQSVFLVDDTVRENVVFGADDRDDDKVWEALRKASLYDFVKQSAEGLDTVVGERGIKLSGGQRQRIAIARAIYSNPQILVLDEATSSLDKETEEAVMESIDSLAGSVTLIIIAHRITTLRNCDRIYEITDGKAVERSKVEVLGK